MTALLKKIKKWWVGRRKWEVNLKYRWPKYDSKDGHIKTDELEFWVCFVRGKETKRIVVSEKEFNRYQLHQKYRLKSNL